MTRKTNWFTMLVCLLCFIGCNRNTEINNQLTPEHLKVAGTGVSLILPTGFEPAVTYVGFENLDASAAILVMETEEPYEDVNSAFDPKLMQRDGVELLDAMPTRVNGLEGTLYYAEDMANNVAYGKHILIFGNHKMSVAVSGVFRKDDNETGKAILASLLSIVYTPGKGHNLVESLPFGINIDDTELMNFSGIANKLTFTLGRKSLMDSKDGVVMVLTSSMGILDLEKSMKQFMLEHVQQFELVSEIIVDSLRDVQIDSLLGYEVVGKGLDKSFEVPALVYEVMLFSENSCYIITGKATDHFDENLTMFRKVSATFHRKK